MLIVSYGIPKSASSFIFQIISQCLATGFSDYRSYRMMRSSLVPAKFQSEFFEFRDDEVEQLLGIVNPAQPFVWKTHSAYHIRSLDEGEDPVLPDILTRANEAGTLRVIASFRDPRDVGLSMMDHGRRDRASGENNVMTTLFKLGDTIPHVKYNFRIARQWHRLPDVLWIPFFVASQQPYLMAECIFRYLGLPNLPFYGVVDELLSDRSQIHQYNSGILDRWKRDLSNEEAREAQSLYDPEIDFCRKMTNNFFIRNFC